MHTIIILYELKNVITGFLFNQLRGVSYTRETISYSNISMNVKKIEIISEYL